MKLEVLLSVLNLKNKDLDKMNITGSCTVINQCDRKEYKKYKNFDIYSFNERGTANSRNRGLDIVKDGIIVLCDDDVIYNTDYEKIILDEFKNNKNADLIIFNMENPYRKKRIIKKRKRLHIYNSLNYAAYNVAFRRKSIKNIRMNNLFGPGAIYKSGGDDTLFIVDCLKKGLKIYSSPNYIGKISSNESTWFKGYNNEYFFNKGALFTAISPLFRHILILQFLIRHKEYLTDLKFKEALKEMNQGSRDYLNRMKVIKC